MKDEQSPEEQSTNDLMNGQEFRVGYDRADDPDVMIFNIPLKRCADDIEYGSALIRGKLEEAKQIALKILVAKRERKRRLTGLAQPNVHAPLGVA